jgi:hypothetical protein
MMKTIQRLVWGGGIAAIFCVSSAIADPPVVPLTIDVNSNTASQLGGEYTSPYNGTVDGVAAQIICDDFATNIPFLFGWDAYAIPVSTLPTFADKLKFKTGPYDNSGLGGQTLTTVQAYTAAAELAVELTNASTLVQADGASPQEELSYAIWQLFDPGAPFNNLTSKSLGHAEADAQAYLTAAEQAAYGGTITASQFTNVTFYTPEPNSQTSQEFITVDEASAPLQLGLYLVCGLALFAGFRKYALAR